MRWEIVNACEFCGSRDAKAFLQLTTTNWYDNRPLELSECASCRMVRATPRPTRNDLYRNQLVGTEKAVLPVKKKLSRPNAIAQQRRAIEEAAKAARRPVSRLYHMDCGAGILLMAARSLGIEVEGTDANRVAVRMLRELDFNVQHGFVDQVDFGDLKVDAVMSIGHLGESYAPFADLKRGHALLETGGTMYLKTIYLGCPDHLAYGQAWKIFGASFVHYFYPETLRAMIEAAGFTVLDMRLMDIAAIVLAVREN